MANSVYKKWHRNICANFQHSTSATSHIHKTLSATLRSYPNFDGGVVVIFIYFLSMYCNLLIDVDNPSILGGATSLISVPSSITLSASAQSQQAPGRHLTILIHNHYNYYRN